MGLLNKYIAEFTSFPFQKFTPYDDRPLQGDVADVGYNVLYSGKNPKLLGTKQQEAKLGDRLLARHLHWLQNTSEGQELMAEKPIDLNDRAALAELKQELLASENTRRTHIMSKAVPESSMIPSRGRNLIDNVLGIDTPRISWNLKKPGATTDLERAYLLNEGRDRSWFLKGNEDSSKATLYPARKRRFIQASQELKGSEDLKSRLTRLSMAERWNSLDPLEKERRIQGRLSDDDIAEIDGFFNSQVEDLNARKSSMLYRDYQRELGNIAKQKEERLRMRSSSLQREASKLASITPEDIEEATRYLETNEDQLRKLGSSYKDLAALEATSQRSAVGIPGYQRKEIPGLPTPGQVANDPTLTNKQKARIKTQPRPSYYTPVSRDTKLKQIVGQKPGVNVDFDPSIIAGDGVANTPENQNLIRRSISSKDSNLVKRTNQVEQVLQQIDSRRKAREQQFDLGRNTDTPLPRLDRLGVVDTSAETIPEPRKSAKPPDEPKSSKKSTQNRVNPNQPPPPPNPRINKELPFSNMPDISNLGKLEDIPGYGRENEPRKGLLNPDSPKPPPPTDPPTGQGGNIPPKKPPTNNTTISVNVPNNNTSENVDPVDTYRQKAKINTDEKLRFQKAVAKSNRRNGLLMGGAALGAGGALLGGSLLYDQWNRKQEEEQFKRLQEEGY